MCELCGDSPKKTYYMGRLDVTPEGHTDLKRWLSNKSQDPDDLCVTPVGRDLLGFVRATVKFSGATPFTTEKDALALAAGILGVDQEEYKILESHLQTIIDQAPKDKPAEVFARALLDRLF